MILLLLAVFGLSAVSSQVLQLKEGEECRPLGGGRGTCRLLSKCATVGDFKTNQPPICDFSGREPIVCCPIKQITSRDKTDQQVEKLCSWLDARCMKNSEMTLKVFNGSVSAARTHPYMALIGYGETEKEWICVGSLITARYVLSATQCSHITVFGPAKWARLGKLDRSSDTDDAQPVDKAIIQRILYPKYKSTELYHNIVLFKLDSDVVFSQYILPICLNTKREITTLEATVIGYGRTYGLGLDEDQDTSRRLLEAKMQVYNDTECKRLAFKENSPRTPRGHDPEQMFCAGVSNGSKEICRGDAGGPLFVQDVANCIPTQIGMVSWGTGCEDPNRPAVVYIRVSNYISWIVDVAFSDGPVY